jgi:hypothetical protein
LDLGEVTLVNRAVVDFLRRYEAIGIELRRCPSWIREWIARETVEARHALETGTEVTNDRARAN